MKKQKKVHKQELILSETVKQELKWLCESGDPFEVPTLLSQCLEEVDSIKQCALLKKVATAFQVKSCAKLPSNKVYKCLAVLAELFVACDIKNPSRKIITSIFESLPRDWSSEVLTSVVLNKITKARNILILGGDVCIRCDVDMISDMLECFMFGTDVLLHNGHFVLEFLGLCLERQLKVSRSESSPAQQTSAMLDCLKTIQTIISFIQKSNSEQDLCNLFDGLALGCIPMKNNGGQNWFGHIYETAREIVKPWKDTMTEILIDLCAVLFDDLFIPDCRTTAGMAIVVVIKVMCPAENVVSTVGKMLFPSHIESENSVYTTFNDPKILSIFQNSKGIADFSHLCLCRGVLTMIPLEFLVQPCEIILKDQEKGGSLMLDALFPDLCCLCDSLKESSRSLLAFRTLTLWANQARQIAVRYHSEGSWIKEKLSGTSPIPSKLLNYVWTHWDHPVEGVRYQTRIICEQVVKMHLILAEGSTGSTKDTFLRDLTASLLKVNCHVKGKYGPLCCIAAVVGASKILQWFPKLPHDMFSLMKDRCLVPHVMEFIEEVASSHKQEISAAEEDIKGWMKTWIVPWLYYLRNGCRLMREHLVQHCLPKLFKCCTESLQFLIEYLQNEPQPSDIGTLITSLKIARGLGLMKDVKTSHAMVAQKMTSLWSGIVPVELMRKALCHLDDQIRLDALGLLCDSPRTTEPVPEIDLQLLQLFLPPNMNNQASSFRQQAGAYFKKFLMRVKEGIRISSKAFKQEKNVNEKQIYQHQLLLYKEFLHWFCSCQFDGLFPGASFARRTTALNNIMLIKQIFSCEESNESVTMTFNINDVMTQDNIHILLDCLSDSYESNKMMAFDILLATPPEQLPFQEEEFLIGWLNMIDRLVSSPREGDASTAATLIKLLMEKCSLPLIFKKDTQHDENLSIDLRLEGVPCTQAFRVLYHFTDLLRLHCEAASENLYLTGVQAPIHSVIYCTRAVLCYVSLRCLAGDEQWQNLISRLLSHCLCAADIVAPVVTSSSPEGFMMEDNEESSQVPQCSVLDQSRIRAPAAQILLVCCWRTMKEVALLLAVIAENAPVQVGNSRHGLLTAKQLDNIGEFFTKVLLTSKHRGAFELAYTGFSKLCAVLWRNADRDLCQLPEQWLQTLLQDLTSATPSETLCGTRRSAGVPFFIQAIVTTEPLASGRRCFKQVMTELLQIASKSVDDSRIRDSTLPQVHANNILRALYRETTLGEAVFPFVSSGVVVAINGFQSESWAVRNSSMLLFSALVTRIFGVKQGRDEHSKKNWMTGREFFSRFPELHSFFLGHLLVGCQGINRDNTVHPSLYPVLVMLSRLYPSTMDGTDTVLSMGTFVPYVSSCRASMVIKIRIMSARAVVPLVSDDLLLQTLHKLLLSLPESSTDEVKHNQIHGTLLHIYHLLSAHAVDATMSTTIKIQIVTDVLPRLKHFKWLGTRCNPCALSQSVFLDIALHFVMDWSWLGLAVSDLSDLAKSGLQSLKQCFKSIAIEEIINKQERSIVIGEVFVRTTAAKIFLAACEELPSALSSNSHLKVSLNQCPLDVQQGLKQNLQEITVNCLEVMQTLLQSSEYEVRLAVLEFVVSHLPSGNNTTLGCWDALENETESWIFKELEGKLKAQLFTMAMSVERHTDCLVKVFQVLYQLPDVLSFPWTLSTGDQVSYFECWKLSTNLINIPRQRDTLKCALLRFLSRMVAVMHRLTGNKDSIIASHSLQALQDFANLILETSSPTESVELRLCTSRVLQNSTLTDLMVDSQESLHAVGFLLWSVVITLLQDEEPVVREQTGEAFSVLLKRIQNSTLVSALAFGDFAVVTPLSLESAMFCVWFLFFDQSSVECVSWMLKWICGDTLCSDDPGQEGDCISDADRLFAKGPPNVYAEDLLVIDAAWKTVQQGIHINDALVVLQRHHTQLSNLLNQQLEKCLVFLEELLLTNWTFNRNLFSRFYRAFAGISVIAMLTVRLGGNNSPVHNRIMVIVHAVRKPCDSAGILLHPKIQHCLDEICKYFIN